MKGIIRSMKYLKGTLRKKNFPVVANYDITSRCNLKCSHCYWRKTYKSKKELSDKEWNKIFLEYKKKGVRMAFLTGGEPALRPKVIRMANKIFSISIVTNGTVKIPEDIQRRIFVSIDGPREIHNKIRKVKCFDRIIKNIKNDKRVILGPTLSTANYKYIDELIQITRDAGVEGIIFSVYTSHKLKGDPLVLEGKKLDYVTKKLREVWKKNKDIVFLTPYIINLFKTKKHPTKCYFRSKSFIAFDANMNIKKPCTLGKGVNCKTCGCIVPIVGYALNHLDIRAIILMNRLFPYRYYQ